MGSHKNNFAKGTKPVTADASDEPSINPLAPSARRQDPAGARRLQTLLRYRRLQKIHGQPVAARKVGASVTTLWRWQNRLNAKGLAGLQPNTSNSGRRSPFKEIRLTAQAVRELELLHVENSSSREAWRKFSFLPVCPPLVEKAVQRSGNVPAALAGIGRVSQVQARVFVSADGRWLFVKLPARAALTTKLSAPAKFNLMRVNK
jgi:hypothetical protein